MNVKRNLKTLVLTAFLAVSVGFFAGQHAPITVERTASAAVFDASTARQNYVSRVRQNAVKLIEALETAKALKDEYDGRAFNDAETGIINGDMVGSNDDLTAAQFKDAVGNIEAYRARFYSEFYATNVYRLRR